ncbi:MAG TPA: hypothetical protein VFE90_16755 [Myxococcales bacterium]|nr:hypothetical protein [Myxococcales bacterium]
MTTLVAATIFLAAAAQPAARRFDLARNFFADDAAEARDREQVSGQFRRLLVLAPDAARSAAKLEVALNLWSENERRFRLHDLYFFARSAVNTEDRHEAEVAALRQSRRQATRAVRDAICAAPEGRLEGFLRRGSRLSRFAWFVHSIRGECRHRPSAPAQSAIDRYEFVFDPSFYFDTVGETQFGSVRSSRGATLDVLKDQGALLADPSPAVREETDRKLWAGYAAHGELFAHGLAQIVKACNARARLASYPSCEEQALAGEELSGPLLRRWYEQIAASWPWARTVPDAASMEPLGLRFSFDEAADIIGRAVAPLGDEYQRETAALLDPRNGRIDVEGGPHRLPMQGTASVDPIGTSIFYAFHFDGNYIDLMLLAHEAGHAVQAMMMRRAGVPTLNGRGAAWMTESFGRFNELLVADYLVRTADDVARSALLRRELLRRAFVLYGAATEGAVELALHDSIARGGRISPAAFSELTRTAGSRFSDRFRREQDALLWTRVESYFADPLHSTTSMMSSLLALILYRDFRRSPDRFVPAYAKLLRNGYDAPSAQLLKRFLSIDLTDETLGDQAIDALKEIAVAFRP